RRAHDRPGAADRGQGAAVGAGRRDGQPRRVRVGAPGHGERRGREAARSERGVSEHGIVTEATAATEFASPLRGTGDSPPVEVPRAVDEVVVLDYGGQYSQLIARRVRECGVFSELLPHHVGPEEVARRRPKGLILSGGPASVYADGAPRLEPE